MVMANYAALNSGSVESEASQSMFADLARIQFNADGSGVKVCVLSDSYNSLGGAAADILSGDLPAASDIDIRSDIPGGTDEGRAMMQLIHDVAPGATLGFHSAFTGFAAFASNIGDFVDNAECDVIVDDVIYLAENAYQDDLIAQAANYARDMGVPYFSSAGNQARQAFEVPVKLHNTKFQGYDVVDFGGSQSITFTSTLSDCSTLNVFQWAEPSAYESGQPGPSQNIIARVEVGGNIIFDVFSQFPIRPAGIFGLDTGNAPCAPITVYFLLADPAGNPLPTPPTTLPTLFRMTFFRGPLSFAAGTPGTEAGTSYGHANSHGAISVGAARWTQTPGFGVSPAVIESFSSAGGIPILFDTNGQPLEKIELRKNPSVVGPQGNCNTFFGGTFGSCQHAFFGTSASAPNVAAVAALMLEVNTILQPDEIRECLECSAEDMDSPYTPWFDHGFDYATGHGFVNAQKALGCAFEKIPEACCADSTLTHQPTMNCMSFVQCLGNGMYSTPQMCPSGLLFNPDINACDWPLNFDCDPAATCVPVGGVDRRLDAEEADRQLRSGSGL